MAQAENFREPFGSGMDQNNKLETLTLPKPATVILDAFLEGRIEGHHEIGRDQ
jgi:hypothetical protein